MSLLANSNAIESGGYNIDRSLRFRSSASAYLSKAAGYSGSRSLMTHSVWVKRGAIGSESVIFSTYIGSTTYDWFGFNASNQIQLVFESSGTTYISLTTSAVFRDPSAWYHIILKCDGSQPSGSRWILYVNGVQQTFTGTDNTTAILWGDSSSTHQLNRNQQNGSCGDCYWAEYNFIGGQALTPSSFGEYSTETGVWVPKKYTGTYGTNGFYLNFKDNTSATTLAYDKSGNGNNWTANNISTTAGATYDSMTDVPTLTSSTAANYCVLNPLAKQFISSTNFNAGNLQLTGASGSTNAYARGTMAMQSGKYYAEFSFSYVSASAAVGIVPANDTAAQGFLTSYATNVSYISTGNKRVLGTNSAYGASYTAGDIIGVAVDISTNTVTFYKNGVSQGDIVSSSFFAQGDCLFAVSTDDTSSPTIYANFGQRPFSYTPPTGFKALNTFNLPDPTIKKPNQYMDATLYTGNGSTQTITNAGGFQPDFVWIKTRDIATSHVLTDSVRGNTKYLFSNNTNAESTVTDAVTSFNSNGFSLSLNGAVNGNSTTYVGWQWKESATAGFDIVTYTAPASGSFTINHSLGVAPKMVVFKCRNSASIWSVYHESTGATRLQLESTTAGTGGVWTVAPTSSTFTLPSSYADGLNYVAYLFAEIPGFSKFGSYTGNGSTDGPFVYCGFRPKYVMIKVASGATNDWCLYDTSRSQYNITNAIVAANSSQAESAFASGYNIDTLSNGFKVRDTTSAVNGSGNTLIFAAFAENPFKYSNAR